jgi:hypothetical protein
LYLWRRNGSQGTILDVYDVDDDNCVSVFLPQLTGLQTAWPYYLANCVLSESTLYFTLSHKRYNSVEHAICVLIFSTTFFRTFLILRRIQRDIIINVHRSLCKINVILVRFWIKPFRDRFSENRQITNFMKTVQWEPSCSVRTDRRMDGQTGMK